MNGHGQAPNCPADALYENRCDTDGLSEQYIARRVNVHLLWGNRCVCVIARSETTKQSVPGPKLRLLRRFTPRNDKKSGPPGLPDWKHIRV